MRILLDRGETTAREIEEHWADPATFAFLPQRGGAPEEWVARSLERIPAALRTGHFALLSSGSTGEPRLVVAARRRAEALVRILHEAQSGEPVRRTVALLPLTYSYAFVNQWLWARTLERAFAGTAGFSQPARLAESLDAGIETMICLVAAHVPLLEQHFGDRLFPAVIRVHFAGSRFPQERLAAVRRLFPNADIFNNYGCIEAMPRLTVRRADEADSADDIGRPLPGIELDAADGRLLFRSPYGAVGFCDDRGFHAFAPDEWVATGDLGHRGDDGRWRLDGRSGDVFKRYGEKVSLPLLLDSLRQAWSGAGAFYRETDPLGEPGHVLFLSPRPTPEQLRAILAIFRERLARATWPLRIESAPSLPMLGHGKVDAGALASAPERRIEWSQRLG